MVWTLRSAVWLYKPLVSDWLTIRMEYNTSYMFTLQSLQVTYMSSWKLRMTCMYAEYITYTFWTILLSICLLWTRCANLTGLLLFSLEVWLTITSLHELFLLQCHFIRKLIALFDVGKEMFTLVIDIWSRYNMNSLNASLILELHSYVLFLLRVRIN